MSMSNDVPNHEYESKLDVFEDNKLYIAYNIYSPIYKTRWCFLRSSITARTQSLT